MWIIMKNPPIKFLMQEIYLFHLIFKSVLVCFKVPSFNCSTAQQNDTFPWVNFFFLHPFFHHFLSPNSSWYHGKFIRANYFGLNSGPKWEVDFYLLDSHLSLSSTLIRLFLQFTWDLYNNKKQQQPQQLEILLTVDCDYAYHMAFACLTRMLIHL